MSNDEADRPTLTDDVEITPEMIAAGMEVLEAAYLGDGRYALTRRTLTEVFCSMLRLRHRAPLPGRENPQPPLQSAGPA